MSKTNILWQNNPYETNARYSLPSELTYVIMPTHIARYKIIIHVINQVHLGYFSFLEEDALWGITWTLFKL